MARLGGECQKALKTLRCAATRKALFTEPYEEAKVTATKKPARSRSAVRRQTKRRGPAQTRALSAARLDEMHDAGEDLTAHFDLANATRPGREIQRVYVDFPADLLRAIDREAKRIGVTRHAFIKLQLADTSSHILFSVRSRLERLQSAGGAGVHDDDL